MSRPGQGEHQETGLARHGPTHSAAIADAELKLLVRELAPFGALSKEELAARVDADRWQDGTFEAALRAGVESGVLEQLGGDFVVSRERPLVGHGGPDESGMRGDDDREVSIGDAGRFVIGTEVLASEGEPCGELRRVIIDPVARALTHLVVAPKHHGGLGRLTPIELVETDHGDQIRLSCDAAQFRALEDSEDVEVVPTSSSVWGYGTGQAYAWPYYGFGGMGAGGMGMGLAGGPQPVVVDRVPLGEVQVCRGDQVHATDGWVGSVQGLVIDPEDHHVTHVLLQEGHLWGRKQVAIPIGTTSRMETGIRLDLTKKQVQDLPPVELSSHP